MLRFFYLRHRGHFRLGRIETSPNSLFKVIAYGYMNGIYSSRALSKPVGETLILCTCWVGHQHPIPTITHFRSERLPNVVGDLFSQLVYFLAEAGELSLRNAFIVGTKFKANANRYCFVWKKSTHKNEAKMQDKMKIELPKIATEFGLRFNVGKKIRAKDLNKLRKRLYALKRDII